MPVAKKLYMENLRVGDELPTMIKPPIERLQIIRYAGASNDYHPLSVDETVAREMQMPGICAPGLLPMGYIGQFVQEWLKGGKLTRFAVRFLKLVWPGDSICCKGRVLARRRDEQGHYLVDIDLWGENQKGETVLKGHATGILYFNSEDEARQKRGEPPLIVDVSERNDLPRTPKPKPARLVDDEDFEGDESIDEGDLDDDEEDESAKAKALRPTKGKTVKTARG